MSLLCLARLSNQTPQRECSASAGHAFRTPAPSTSSIEISDALDNPVAATLIY
jgi:hypothetical protein